MADIKTAVVVPNWNGKDSLAECLDSLKAQSVETQIIAVDNGSLDGSAEFIQENYPEITLIKHRENLGFAGGVNAGIRKAIELDLEYVALLNNDAFADKNWISSLTSLMDMRKEVGIATSKICDDKKTYLDSTGEEYTTWGLPYPRGRGEKSIDKYDEDTVIFAASGGASIYRVKTLKEIGLFDEDFFAYYEDVDISFRAQLSGWKVAYVPEALVYHQIGATSTKIKGFTTYQTMKNLPLLLVKNVPGRLFWTVLPRFKIAYWSFFISAIARGQGWPALKGFLVSLVLLPKKVWQRYRIQSARKVSVDYIDSIITHDLPPNARKLRILRTKYRKLVGRNS